VHDAEAERIWKRSDGGNQEGEDDWESEMHDVKIQRLRMKIPAEESVKVLLSDVWSRIFESTLINEGHCFC
jgi:hypothetical protein